MTVGWTPTVIRDLESLHAYIEKDDADAASGGVESILSAIDALTRHPGIGRKGRVPGTRELVVSPCVVAYRGERSAVELVAIIHAARRWPDSF